MEGSTEETKFLPFTRDFGETDKAERKGGTYFKIPKLVLLIGGGVLVAWMAWITIASQTPEAETSRHSEFFELIKQGYNSLALYEDKRKRRTLPGDTFAYFNPDLNISLPSAPTCGTVGEQVLSLLLH